MNNKFLNLNESIFSNKYKKYFPIEINTYQEFIDFSILFINNVCKYQYNSNDISILIGIAKLSPKFKTLENNLGMDFLNLLDDCFIINNNNNSVTELKIVAIHRLLIFIFKYNIFSNIDKESKLFIKRSIFDLKTSNNYKYLSEKFLLKDSLKLFENNIDLFYFKLKEETNASK